MLPHGAAWAAPCDTIVAVGMSMPAPRAVAASARVNRRDTKGLLLHSPGPLRAEADSNNFHDLSKRTPPGTPPTVAAIFSRSPRPVQVLATAVGPSGAPSARRSRTTPR